MGFRKRDILHRTYNNAKKRSFRWLIERAAGVGIRLRYGCVFEVCRVAISGEASHFAGPAKVFVLAGIAFLFAWTVAPKCKQTRVIAQNLTAAVYINSRRVRLPALLLEAVRPYSRTADRLLLLTSVKVNRFRHMLIACGGFYSVRQVSWQACLDVLRIPGCFRP